MYDASMSAPGGNAPPLDRALDAAIANDTRALYTLLARHSGLPGPRANDTLAIAFADACRARGKIADGVALTMAKLDADAAPGATPLEFIVACGVAALGARAATDDAVYPSMLAAMHDVADDLRFRVRDHVVMALARIGERRGDALVDDVASWMDGYFHAAAVVRAMGIASWLSSISRPEALVARCDEAFLLLRDAPRAAARYPGHKSLVEVLSATPREAAARFGVPIFDMLVRWTSSSDPALRDIVEKNLGGSRLAGRHAAEIARVKAALKSTTAPVRNPDHYVGPTRGRGRKKQGGKR
jgi:hypothetical protein